jgi:sodium-dependent dicarboxylate transporter 2/3/5
VSVAKTIDDRQPQWNNGAFKSALMLSIAYAANIGGVATLIGSPPNALYAAYMKSSFGIEVTFLSWMMVGLPVAFILLPVAWLLLTRILFVIPKEHLVGGRALFRHELAALGPMSKREKLVAMVFVATATAWLSHPFLADWKVIPVRLDDAQIAIAAMVALFAIPASQGKAESLLQWRDMKEAPWEILILFGGGLALANAITATDLTGAIQSVSGHVRDWAPLLTSLLLCLFVLFLTEVTSNTATAAAFLPLSASLAVGIGVAPELMTLPVVLAASCAFMLPVATPPNAIVYATNTFTINQMMRSGFALNLICAVVIVLVVFTLV